MPSEDLLLSELCTICHQNPPKYRCPRCLTRTCSLPCTKRHKLWSQCNGVRDPATYLKRSELATPKAFDHDFNFITGIERVIERAGQSAGDRGVVLNNGQNGRASGHHRGEISLAREIERARVMVDRAPKGMRRSQQNQTRWLPKSKQIAWTIEWRTADRSEVQHDCLETVNLDKLYNAFVQSKEPKEPKQKKRKVNTSSRNADSNGEETRSDAFTERDDTKRSENTSSYEAEEKGRTEDEAPSAIQKVTPFLSKDDPQSTLAHFTNDGQLLNDSADAAPQRKHQETNSNSPSHAGTKEGGNTSTPIRDQKFKRTISTTESPHLTDLTQNFYLPLPHTPSNVRTILIPLSPSTTLANALKDHVVLEFPSIYVLAETQDQLKATGEFITEEDYVNGLKEEDLSLMVDELEAAGMSTAAHGDNQDERKRCEALDERRVLEMLKKDIGSGVS